MLPVLGGEARESAASLRVWRCPGRAQRHRWSSPLESTPETRRPLEASARGGRPRRLVIRPDLPCYWTGPTIVCRRHRRVRRTDPRCTEIPPPVSTEKVCAVQIEQRPRCCGSIWKIRCVSSLSPCLLHPQRCPSSRIPSSLPWFSPGGPSPLSITGQRRPSVGRLPQTKMAPLMRPPLMKSHPPAVSDVVEGGGVGTLREMRAVRGLSPRVQLRGRQPLRAHAPNHCLHPGQSWCTRGIRGLRRARSCPPCCHYRYTRVTRPTVVGAGTDADARWTDAMVLRPALLR